MHRLRQGWLLIFLTLSLMVLTCLQARGSILTRGIQLVDHSRGYSVFVLRAISELAGLSLSATISATWERIKWALVCCGSVGHEERARFMDFLALDEGTKPIALLGLAGGSAAPGWKTRAWSIARLMSMALIPVTGILIMSQVEIQLAFSREKSYGGAFGYDLHEMNASMAYEYLGFSDLVLSANFGGFLSNPARVVDLTAQRDGTASCSLNLDSQETQRGGCHRKYFIAGETLFAFPDMLNDASFPMADVILAQHHRGFVLEFDSGDSSIDFQMEECRTYSSRFYGSAAGAVRLCVGSSAPNQLQARLVSCPGPIAALQACTNDTSWYDNIDWTIAMSAFFQYASVAYSRSNGTILSHKFTDEPPVPVNITPAEILQAYDALLLDTTKMFRKNSTDMTPFSGSTFPAFLWMAEPIFSGINGTNPALSNGIFKTLQSLLAMPLYLCQNGQARRLLPVALGSKSIETKGGLTALLTKLSPLPERTSPASFAYHRYEVVASMPTLIAYMTLSGAALIFCCIAQLLTGATFSRRNGREGRRATRIPLLSNFAALDLFAHCTIEDQSRYVVYQGRSGTFHYDALQGSRNKWLSTLSIKWSRPASLEDWSQIFSVRKSADNMRRKNSELSSADGKSLETSRSALPMFWGKRTEPLRTCK